MRNNFELGAQDGVEEKVASELGLRDGRGGESASSCLHTRGTEWARGQGCWAAGEGGGPPGPSVAGLHALHPFVWPCGSENGPEGSCLLSHG